MGGPEFRAVDAQARQWKPPSADEWRDHINFVFPYIRLAWETMYKTKAELGKVYQELGDDTFGSQVEDMVHSREFFERFVGVLRSAEIRLICAATAVELKEEAR